MSSIPRAVREYALEGLLTQRSAVYLSVSATGELEAHGGAMARLSAACRMSERGLLTHLVDTLGDFAPHASDDPAIVLSMLEVADGVCVDVHVFSAGQDGGDATWFLLLDASERAARRQRQQQDEYDRGMEADRRSKIIKRYLGGTLTRFLVNEGTTIRDIASRRELSILFADLREFTNFCAGRSPDEIFATLNAYVGTMIVALQRHGGAVDKVMGDAVMGIFGLGEGAGAAPERALRAAVDIVKDIELLNASRRELGKPTLAVGVGVATGPVMVGAVGSRARRSLSVFGHPVNLASRLQGAARGGEVVSDDGTYARAAAGGQTVGRQSASETIEVKGVAGLVTVHRLRP